MDGAVPRHTSLARRPSGGVEYERATVAHVTVRLRGYSVDPGPGRLCVYESESGSGSHLLSHRGAGDASHLPASSPHLSFVNSTTQDALATLDRVELVARYAPGVAYPDNGFGQALRAVAGVMVEQLGTQVFWVQTGGFDTHASQNTITGRYADLMTSLNDGLLAFYTDLRNQGLLDDVLVLEFSEFGRRVSENGSSGTDHGAAGLMMAIGGRVAGGLYGTAPTLADTPDNPTLENGGRDVSHETDFRSVYARVIDDWLGSSSVSVLGGDFRNAAVNFV